jgi:hypothetical protein
MASLQTQGQPHDRILSPSGNGALDMPAEPNLIGKPVEVTTSITQKMLSATTGSLLTSLLGMWDTLPFRHANAHVIVLLVIRHLYTLTNKPSQ